MQQKPLSENQKRKLKSFYVCGDCGRAFKSKITHENGRGMSHCGAMSEWGFETDYNPKNNLTFEVDIEITKTTTKTRKIKANSEHEAWRKANEFNCPLNFDGMGNSYECVVLGMRKI